MSRNPLKSSFYEPRRAFVYFCRSNCLQNNARALASLPVTCFVDANATGRREDKKGANGRSSTYDATTDRENSRGWVPLKSRSLMCPIDEEWHASPPCPVRIFIFAIATVDQTTKQARDNIIEWHFMTRENGQVLKRRKTPPSSR